MTLASGGLAWGLVAVLFVAWTWLARKRQMNGAAAAVLMAEAGVLTLFAGLWFSTLGHDGWALVFGLVGILVSGSERGTRAAFLRSPAGPELLEFVLGVARYLAAGALLAWRLG